MTGDASAGRLIGGRYRLIRPIGSGGFGRVWEARDETLQVDVAVKEVWLPPSSEEDHADRLARARREARNAARPREHGGPGQQWTTTPDGELVNPESGMCLDATGASTENGTRLQIWGCSGNANQKWTLP